MTAGPITLAVDCGGTAIKAAVLDGDAVFMTPPLRLPTPYPLSPETLLAFIMRLIEATPTITRVTVGLPGMIRRGVVVNTPHYVTTAGPGSPPDQQLVDQWHQFPFQERLAHLSARPTLVLNDAPIHAAGVIAGHGTELTLTLGTGLGWALFQDGHLAPHLEVSQSRISVHHTIDSYISEQTRRRLGDVRWSRRVIEVVSAIRPVVVWDRLYLGGGNCMRLTAAARAQLPADVQVVPNSAGLTGGVHIWSLLAAPRPSDPTG